LNQIIHSYNIQLLNLEAEKVNLLHSKSDEIFKLTQEKDNLETQLKLFKSIDLESDEVLTLSQEKNRLDSELEFLMNQNPTSTQLIGKILGNNISTKKEVIILLSFIFGLFLSIVIVLINNSLKAFKEE
jgi:tetrahydromethanopterin S-methyltransferase subunit G